MIKLILLDMDGVCADFVGAAAWRYGRDPKVTTWNFPEVEWGLTQKDFWSGLQDFEFWSGLGQFHYFPAFYRALKTLAPVKFCSSPSQAPQSLAGKLAWLQDRFGEAFGDFIFARDKTPLARPDVLLIDDSDRNVDEFRKAGGEAICFPQQWNRRYNLAGSDAWEIVLDEAKKICKKDLRSWEDMVE